MSTHETNSTPDIYLVMREWFEFASLNPEKIRPIHSALIFFLISHANRLRWPDRFGLPTQYTMHMLGISTYRTYISTLKDLCDWGYISLVEKSKNQHTANIVACDFLSKAKQKQSKSKAKAKQKQNQSKAEAEQKQSSDNNTLEYSNTTEIKKNIVSGAHTREGELFDLPWSESGLEDYDTFVAKMKETGDYREYADAGYRVDFKHYHAVISEWAINGGHKKMRWVPFCWGWIRRDRQNGKIQIIKPRIAL